MDKYGEAGRSDWSGGGSVPRYERPRWYEKQIPHGLKAVRNDKTRLVLQLYAESFSAICFRVESIRSAVGMPPWAMSLLPPPRPPSCDMVSFISDPMSNGWPTDWAKTSDGCGDVVARRATEFADRRASFWASSLMELRSRSANVRTMSLRELVSEVSASKVLAWASANSSSDCSRSLRRERISSSDLRACCGTS